FGCAFEQYVAERRLRPCFLGIQEGRTATRQARRQDVATAQLVRVRLHDQSPERVPGYLAPGSQYGLLPARAPNLNEKGFPSRNKQLCSRPSSAGTGNDVRNFLTSQRGRTALPAPPGSTEGRQYRPPWCRGGTSSSASWHPHLPFMPARF